MSQKGRISLSQARAVGEPLGIEQALSEARLKARDGVSSDVADAVRAQGVREEFRKLAAPPSAQKRASKLTKLGRMGEIAGWMAAPRRKRGREAKPPKKIDPTSSAPTPERQSKEPNHGLPVFHTALYAGGQVSHEVRRFLDTFDKHISTEVRQAFQLLQDGYEIAQRSRSTSDRAYTGAPYTGASVDREGHVALTEKDRRDLELFAWSWQELVNIAPEMAERLKMHILRIANERTGRLQSVAELGASATNYGVKTDNATAAGVMAILDAGIVYKGALQAAAMKMQYARMRRHAVFAEEAARYAQGAKARRDRDVEHDKQKRVEKYRREIEGRALASKG